MEQERKAFEAYLLSEGVKPEFINAVQGEYDRYPIAYRWQGWQARANLPTHGGDVVERVVEAIDNEFERQSLESRGSDWYGGYGRADGDFDLELIAKAALTQMQPNKDK